MFSILYIVNNITRTCFHINDLVRCVYPMNFGKIGKSFGDSKVGYQNV